jgi:hypothetical protein
MVSNILISEDIPNSFNIAMEYIKENDIPEPLLLKLCEDARQSIQ